MGVIEEQQVFKGKLLLLYATVWEVKTVIRVHSS
jgi:hypothetical protein